MTDPMQQARELLPCPFCGGDAERIDFGPGDAENDGGSCIACKRCHASGPVEFGFKENFIANWNRRAALRSAPEWQPIESAPKDSRWLMIGIAGRNEIMLGYWSRLHQGWWGQTSAHGEFEIWRRATHWMAMPDAPAVRPQGVSE